MEPLQSLRLQTLIHRIVRVAGITEAACRTLSRIQAITVVTQRLTSAAMALGMGTRGTAIRIATIRTVLRSVSVSDRPMAMGQAIVASGLALVGTEEADFRFTSVAERTDGI